MWDFDYDFQDDKDDKAVAFRILYTCLRKEILRSTSEALRFTDQRAQES